MKEHLQLADLCNLIVDCKNRTPPAVCEGESPVGHAIGTPHIGNGKIRLNNATLVGQETFDTWTARAVPQADDVVLSREAPVGRVGRVEPGMNVCLGQRTMLMRPNPEVVDPRFLPYLLLGPQVQNELHSRASGSTVPHLRVGQVRHLTVTDFPEIGTQRAIAEILGALDDKIAVNERIAETAAELAETLYVHKASSARGWTSVPLAETSRWLSGGTPKTSEPSYWGGGTPWISAASLKSPWLDDADRKVTREGAENGTRLVPEGSVIFVVRGMSLTSEFRIGLTQREVAFGQDCKALLPLPGIDPATLFLAIKSRTPEILGCVDLAGHGTGRLATDRIAKLSVKLPDGSSADDFARSVVPLVKRASATKRENRTLTALRDTLLPQLVSGKIRVKDAERVVEDAV